MSATAPTSSSSMITAVTNYNAAVLTMAQYAQTILATNFSGLSGIDSTDYANFIEAVGQMDNAAANWVQEVQPSLLNLTGTVTSANSLVNLYLTEALTSAQSLNSDPSNGALLQALNQAMTNASQNVNSLQSFVQSTANLVSQNSTLIPTATSSLTNVQNALTSALNQENAGVQGIQSSISQMQAKIASLQSPPPSAGEIVHGAIFLVGFILTFATGGASWSVALCVNGFVGAALAANQNADVTGQDLSELQTQVANLQNQLNDDNAIVAAATAIQSTASSLSTTLSNLVGDSSPLQQIQSFVTGNLQELQAVSASITQAQQDEGNWGDVVAQLQAASAEWQTLQQADLPTGMTITTYPLQVIAPAGSTA
jgi:type IV secretory pathway VirB2 component (pilin)